MNMYDDPVLNAILARRSTRAFTEEPVDEESIRAILRAGMSGPSCVNARDWSFIAVTDPDMLGRMADANGRPAEPLRRAKLGILVCGELERAFPRAKDYWVIDAAIAGQNMTLAAEALGLGSVWLGTWPQMERVEAQRRLFDLPEHIVPHSIIAFGHPAPEGPARKKPEWEADRVHREKW